MAFNRSQKLSLLLLSLFGSTEAFWRMSCSLIQTSRIDPVVNPGTISGHAHKISGASTIYVNSTHDSLLSAPCTSCEIQDDKSAYWTPLLYYQHSDGSFEEVKNGGTVVYYLGRGDDRANVKPFPKGFRMVSGNPGLRSYDNQTLVNGNGRPLGDRVSFNCLNYKKGNPETPGLPSIDCPQGLRAQIQFQSCWNGVDLYKTDQSHVAYLSQIDNGICPSSHPVLLPHLFFEILYDTASIKQDGGKLVFAQGDPTGYGFHGDFLNGWDMAVQTNAVQNCLNTDNNGQISACPSLVKSQVSNYGNICPEMSAIVDEPVRGTIKKLPGCINIVNGPAAASSADMNCPAGSAQPTLLPPAKQSSAATQPSIGTESSGWKYAGCASERSSGRALSVASWSSDNMTNAACQKFCESKELPLAGTEHGRECWCGNQLEGDSKLGVDCSKNSMLCTGNSSEFCGGSSIVNVWNSTTLTTRSAIQPGTQVGSYKYLGCASEASSGRALTGASFTNSTGMTNDVCGSFCASKSFSMFGTEYGSECYCGNKLAAGSTYPQDGCSKACTGKVDAKSSFAKYSNVCGGASRLSLFSIASR